MDFPVTIDNATADPSGSVAPEKIRIVYWNMTSSADNKRTFEFFVEIVRPDVILITNVGKDLNPNNFPLKDFHILHISSPFNASESVHCVFVRDETIRPHVLDIRGWGSTVFHFQSIDIQLKNAVHRLILVASDSEEATLQAIPGISEVLTPEENSKVEFVHILGTLNSTEYRLQNVFPEGFHSLLNPEWKTNETNENRQDDIALSKSICNSEELLGHVLGHKTFRWPRWEQRYAIFIEVGEAVNEGKNLFCYEHSVCPERTCDWFKHDYDEDDYLNDDYCDLFDKKKVNGVPLLSDT